MKIRIGGLEITDLTVEELDQIIRKYGTGADASHEESPQTTTTKTTTTKLNGASTNGGATTDLVVLRKLVESGDIGVPSTTLGDMLGRKGKATRAGVRDWAKRVGIIGDSHEADPIEDCRSPSNQRSIRLKSAFRDIGQAILADK